VLGLCELGCCTCAGAALHPQPAAAAAVAVLHISTGHSHPLMQLHLLHCGATRSTASVRSHPQPVARSHPQLSAVTRSAAHAELGSHEVGSHAHNMASFRRFCLCRNPLKLRLKRLNWAKDLRLYLASPFHTLLHVRPFHFRAPSGLPSLLSSILTACEPPKHACMHTCAFGV
jgi:hypothetical protein